jgi:26S proteasome regulatory subunit N5
MSELLNLPENEVEDFLSTMVVKGSVEAKTDRLEGVVNFKKTQNPNDLLNEWSFNISELMSHVQKTTHLINKEEMVHKLKGIAVAAAAAEKN